MFVSRHPLRFSTSQWLQLTESKINQWTASSQETASMDTVMKSHPDRFVDSGPRCLCCPRKTLWCLLFLFFSYRTSLILFCCKINRISQLGVALINAISLGSDSTRWNPEGKCLCVCVRTFLYTVSFSSSNPRSPRLFSLWFELIKYVSGLGGPYARILLKFFASNLLVSICCAWQACLQSPFFFFFWYVWV